MYTLFQTIMGEQMKNTFKLLCILIMIVLVLAPSNVYAASSFLDDKYIIMQDEEITQLENEDIVVVLGSANVSHKINGTLIVLLGDAIVNDDVNGDIISILGDVKLQEGVNISGNVVSVGKLDKPESVTIGGTKLTASIDWLSMFNVNSVLISVLILLAIVTLGTGLIMISIFTVNFRVISNSFAVRPGRKMVLGILFIVASTIILAFLIFLFVAPILYILLFIIADIVGGIIVGRAILKANDQKSTIFLQFFIGHILVSMCKIVPVLIIDPKNYTGMCIYGIILVLGEIALASFGFGTIIDTSFGKKVKNISQKIK